MKRRETYDYLVTTRRHVLDGVRPLSAQQHARPFPIGLGTIAETLTHVMISEWYYVQRMRERDVPPYEEWPIRQEAPPPFATIEDAWTRQADETQADLGAVRDGAATIEYEVTEGRREIVTTTADALFTQLVLHEVHHRAQVLAMLRQLGVTVPPLDFNSFFARRAAPPA